MTITATATPAIETTRVATGSYIDVAGSPAVANLAVGFPARHVRLLNQTDNILLEWFEGMAANSAIQTAANGARTVVTTPATGGIAVTDRGVAFTPLQNKQYRYVVLG